MSKRSEAIRDALADMAAAWRKLCATGIVTPHYVHERVTVRDGSAIVHAVVVRVSEDSIWVRRDEGGEARFALTDGRSDKVWPAISFDILVAINRDLREGYERREAELIAALTEASGQASGS